MENKIPVVEEKYISKSVVEDMIDEKIAQIPTPSASGTNVFMGQIQIPGNYVEKTITGLPFRPKAIMVTVNALIGSYYYGAWGSAVEKSDGSIQQSCMYAGPVGGAGPTTSFMDNETRLFRFDGNNVGSLVRINNDGFTVKSDVNCKLTYVCFA